MDNYIAQLITYHDDMWQEGDDMQLVGELLLEAYPYPSLPIYSALPFYVPVPPEVTATTWTVTQWLTEYHGTWCTVNWTGDELPYTNYQRAVHMVKDLYTLSFKQGWSNYHQERVVDLMSCYVVETAPEHYLTLLQEYSNELYN